MPRDYSKLGPLIGALLGGGVGELENVVFPGGALAPSKYKGEGAPLGAQLQTIGFNALLGGLIGSKTGRRWLRKPSYEPMTMGSMKDMPVGTKFPALGRQGLSFVRLLSIPSASATVGWGAPRGSYPGKEFLESYFHQKDPGSQYLRAGNFVNEVLDDPKKLITDLASESGSKTVNKSVKDLVTNNAPELLKYLGIATGSGIAGALGGRSLGGALGDLVFEDDPELDYETRRKREERRNLMKTIGQVLGGTALYAGVPLLYSRYGGK